MEIDPTPAYLTQIAGPTSLETLERAADESLRDIGFLRFRDATIAGRTVEVGRIGMSGNLAYEVRGPLEDGPEIYDAMFRAGQDLGIQRLGWATYLVNHVEGGFPQMTWKFASAAYLAPGYREFLEGVGFRPAFNVSGSVDPADIRARLRTPDRGRVAARGEVRPRLHRARGAGGRGRRSEADRRDAAVEPGGRRRHLRLAAAARRGVQDDRPAHLAAVERGHEHPRGPPAQGRPADRRLLGTIYSYYYREVLSNANIDVDQAEIGNEVVVQWGDHGRRIKDVRATVERYPYLSEARNSEVDTATLAR